MVLLPDGLEDWASKWVSRHCLKSTAEVNVGTMVSGDIDLQVVGMENALPMSTSGGENTPTSFF
jgi:hypothetical protein